MYITHINLQMPKEEKLTEKYPMRAKSCNTYNIDHQRQIADDQTTGS